jgi:hypothetical protein
MEVFGSGFLTDLFALDRPGVVWRHDVDYDPACALQMAELEKRCGVQATYYIRARGPYNPFSDDVRRVLHGIVAFGHRLGVHVDLGLPRDADAPGWLLTRTVERDYLLLLLEYPVTRRVSFHAPPRAVYGVDVPGFAHAFAGEWKNRTVSDSRGVWHGDPVEALLGDHPVCLSIHPEWSFWPEETAAEWRVLEAAKP